MTGEKPHRCSVCSAAFAQKGSLTQHIRTHTGEKPYQCEICEKRFLLSSSLQAHKRKHHSDVSNIDNTRYKCLICNKVFTTSGSRTKHARVQHMNQCSRCGEVCKTAEMLVQHRKAAHSQHGQKTTNFQCPECEKTFAHQDSMKEHFIMKHDTSKANKCLFCDKIFPRPNRLQRHINAKHKDTEQLKD